MNWFNDLPVRRKLRLAMLLTSTIGLVVACLFFLTLEYFGYRRNLLRTVHTLSRITADNSTAPLAFVDQKAARENLEALGAEPQISAAILYDGDGKVFAQFVPQSARILPHRPDDPPGIREEKGSLVVVRRVAADNRQLGTLYLQATMDGIYARMRDYAIGALGILVLTIALTWQFASLLRRTLTRPILELANTAEAIAADQDYTRRARGYGLDELGRLTAVFNAMVAKTYDAIFALRESEWRHRELVRALPTAAYMCDDRGRITVFNEAAVALWGRKPEVGDEYWRAAPSIFRTDGTPLPRDACPMSIALREGRAVRGEEIILERPDGTRRNIMPHPEPIRDTGGRLTGIVNMLVDITESKRAQAASRRLAAIVESSDDAIVGKDLNGVIRSWNKGAESLFGYSAEEALGQSVAMLMPPAHMDEELGILERVKRGESIKFDETVRRRRDGTLVDVSVTISPIKDENGRIVGASKIAHDISERKRIQQQSDFIGQLSHQLGGLSSPHEVMQLASRAIGLQLEVDRCYFSLLDENASQILVVDEWRREGFCAVGGMHRTTDFGTPDLWRALASGPLAVDDKATHPLTQNLGDGYAPLRIAAHATVPFRREGTWVALLTVTMEFPRRWRSDELALLENALGRIWPMVERARTQQALQESERRLSDLMRSLPMPCYTIAVDGSLTFYNHAAEQLWGRTPELGSTRWCGSLEMTTVDGAPVALEESPVALALRQKRSVRGIEAMVLRPDGSRRWVVPNPDPIFDVSGNCTGVINVVMDVTEERNAQAKIRKVAEHLSLAIASADLGDWSWEADSGRISFSLRMAEIYGIPASSALTRSCVYALMHVDDRERSLSALNRAVETRSDYGIEYRVNRPDGSQRWVAEKGRPSYDSQGRLHGMVGVVQDITERKRQVQELEELSRKIETQARLFDATLSNIADLAYSFDLKGRWIYANRPLLNLWNRSLDQVAGKDCYELGYPPQLAERIQTQVQEVIATKGSVRGETPYADATGRIDDHEYIFSPVIDSDGRVTAVVGTTRLVTERKKVENELKRARDEAMAASRAKDDFLAALSHELRTPLNPVLLLASAAAKNPQLPAETRADFDFVRRNVELEARLIDDLLDLTRITRGKLQLEQRPNDLHVILTDAINNVRQEIAEKDLQLNCEFAPVECLVWGDSVRLQQILWNLLKNAVKFTPVRGRIGVTTRVEGEKLLITITDTGIGMVPEEIDRVFKAFAQGEHALPGSNLHRFGGLGLGLAISKMLVELHDGRIEAQSAGRNQGATFIVELPRFRNSPGAETGPARDTPVCPPDSLAPGSDAGARPLNRFRGQPGRVLLVEDHAPTRLTLMNLLKLRAYEVVAAKLASDALALVRDGEFALIISDVGLPDRNGYELMAELRAIKPGLIGIALSGYGMEEDLARSRAAGFRAHLVKPITIEMLEDAIARVLSPPVDEPSDRCT